jgi:hypothetical protein
LRASHHPSIPSESPRRCRAATPFSSVERAVVGPSTLPGVIVAIFFTTLHWRAHLTCGTPCPGRRPTVLASPFERAKLTLGRYLTASHTLSDATKSALNIPRRFHVEPVLTPVRFSLEHAAHPCEAVQN